MKRKSSDLSDMERMQTLDALYTAAGTVKGRAAMKLFLRDLLTESERIMLGRRILIARKLLAGASYGEIGEELKVGFDTIERIQHWLHDQLPGYEKAVEEMEKEFKKREERSRMTADGKVDRYLYATSALYRLKKKYPLHFLLFPTPKRKE
jgi:uncharacterized protein YerC